MKYLGNPAELRASLGLTSTGAVSFRNRIVNGNFAVNQRNAGSGSTAYAAGAYVMDRWKAGAGGCTLSWSTAASGDVTVTITAGTLMQVIEGSLYLPEGGAYVMNWVGTAQARVTPAGGSASAYYGNIVLAGLTAGANLTVEFGTGTVSAVQLEPGTAATPFERRDDELRRCQRYYLQLTGPAYFMQFSGYAPSGANAITTLTFPSMRTAPTASFIGSWIVSNCTVLTGNSTASTVLFGMTAASTGYVSAANPLNGGIALSAEL